MTSLEPVRLTRRRFTAAASAAALAIAAAPVRAADDAKPSAQLRVLTYNIHHGEGTDGKLDLERIAAVIKSTQADLVALQEVEHETGRTGHVAQADELGRLTGLHAVFGGNIDFQGGRYGNAVLSRFPIRSHSNHLLPRLMEGEQRGVLEVEIAWPAAGDRLVLLATHLDHRPSSDERQQSAEWINKQIADRRDLPAILAGDLNATPDSGPLQTIRRQWTMTNRDPLLTSPAGKPRRQIDYVLVRPAKRWKVTETRVIDEPIASDHRPLLATLELLPAED